MHIGVWTVVPVWGTSNVSEKIPIGVRGVGILWITSFELIQGSKKKLYKEKSDTSVVCFWNSLKFLCGAKTHILYYTSHSTDVLYVAMLSDMLTISASCQIMQDNYELQY